MYEASFRLKRRPFAATPDASCFLSAAPIQAALDELVVCVEQGQGIAVLTAPAGTGKTLLCERLRCELDESYETIFLRHASFLTRRALLQTILCELNHQYHHPSEQELRLELFPAIRALQPKREALVLICDEAHQLTDSLLEELRILADFAEAGRPLVRLVLVGQLSLEEKLAQPGLEAFNQRIRAQINLTTFDHAQSQDYVDYRVTWAGGRTEEVFTPAALDLIVRASDGVPRCINQLADHTLLLAFVAEQRPAGEDLVREALSDLRQLPLHWNESSQTLVTNQQHLLQNPADDSLPALPAPAIQDASGFLKDATAGAATYSFEPELGVNEGFFQVPSLPVEPTAIDIPHGGPKYISHDEFQSSQADLISRVEVGNDDWQKTVELFNPSQPDPVGTLGGLIPDSANVTSDEQTRFRLKRRIDFHNLLQEAYDAAGESLSPGVSQSLAQSMRFDQTTNQVMDRSAPVSNSTREIRTSNISVTNPAGVNTTHAIYEEVIVDRYTVIDAGMQPPAIPSADTVEVNVVRAGQYPVDVFLQPLPSLIGDHVGTNATILKSDLSATGSLESDGRATGHQQIEKIAEEVYSLGDALRPTESLSSSSDSILRTLRKEVDDIHDSMKSEFTHQIAQVTRTTTWEAIETPPAPPAAESRPLRYLFSQLRRKQQGLS